MNNYQTDNECNNWQSDYPIPRPMPVPMPLPVPELVDLQPTEETTDSIEAFQYDYVEVEVFPGWGSSSYDATKSFRDSNIVYLSDLNVHKECRSTHKRKYKTLGRAGSLSLQEPDYDYYFIMDYGSMEMAPIRNARMIAPDNSFESPASIKQTVRAFFPETWLWDIQISNEKGLIERVEKSPDSITDWQIDAYCFNSKSGLGVAETQTLNVFQSMFVSMTLPYSVVKGEVFPVKATVFNYANTCVPIQIELLADKRFSLKKGSAETTASYCICADEQVTHKFRLEAEQIEMSSGLRVAASVTSVSGMDAKVGEEVVDMCRKEGKSVVKAFRFRDVESKFVIVEPEGIPKEHVENSLVLFKCKFNI